MHLRRAPITLATALAAVFAVSAAAQAGMNNISVSPAVAPRLPDIKARPVTIDANIRLHCYPTRERNELGVWVHRTRCN